MRQLTLSLITLLIALAGAGQIVIATLHRSMQETIGEDMAVLVQSHAAALDQQIERTRQILQGIADNAPERAFENPDQAQAYLTHYAPLLALFDLGLYMANPDEIILGAQLRDMQQARKRIGGKTSASDLNWRAREQRRTLISQPYASPSCDGCPAIAMVTPVFHADGRFLGYVAGALRLDGENMLAAINDVRVGKTGYLYLLTRERTMIMHPDPRRIMKPATRPGQNQLLDKAITEGFEGHGQTINSLGVPMILGVHYLKSTGWLLAANYPLADAEAPFEVVKTRAYLLLAVIGILMAAALGLIFRRKRHTTADTL